MSEPFHPEALKTYRALSWKAQGQSWVYFVQMCEVPDSPVKIGWAINPTIRLDQLQTGNPYPLEIRQLIVGGIDEEARLHTRWSEARLRGEWFGGGCQAAIVAMADEIAERQMNPPRAMWHPGVVDPLGDVLWEAPKPTRWPQIGDGVFSAEARA